MRAERFEGIPVAVCDRELSSSRWRWCWSPLLCRPKCRTIWLDGVPPLPSALPAEVGRYLEFRTAGIQDWHPHRREMLVTTRFAEAAQLHVVAAPGRARRQLTFLPEPVSGGSYDPQAGAFLVFSKTPGR